MTSFFLGLTIGIIVTTIVMGKACLMLTSRQIETGMFSHKGKVYRVTEGELK